MVTSRNAINRAAHRLASGDAQANDIEVLFQYRKEYAEIVPELLRRIRKVCGNHANTLGVRLKRVDAILRKLNRIKTMKVTTMDDILGARIVVPSYSAQSQLRRAFEDFRNWEPRVRDYASSDGVGGYRAVHVSWKLDGADRPLAVEIQFRTPYQNLWSTMSESFGLRVKDGGGAPVIREYLADLSKRIREREERDPKKTQTDIIAGGKRFTWRMWSFRKGRGDIGESWELGDDALTAFQYFENLERDQTDMSREITLLGNYRDGDVDSLQVSHQRYFRVGGVPTIPQCISEGLNRPPQWAA